MSKLTTYKQLQEQVEIALEEPIPNMDRNRIKEARKATYGDFTNNMNDTARLFNALVPEDEAIEGYHVPLLLQCLKFIRSTSTYHEDNFIDMQAYNEQYHKMRKEKLK